MFLLKRRSDGKFFRNRGYHQDSSWRFDKGDDPRWVDDPSNCVPFASVSGLRNSRGVALGSPLHRPAESNKDKTVWDAYWKQVYEWNGKKNTKVRREWENNKFNEKYEIVEVKYTCESTPKRAT